MSNVINCYVSISTDNLKNLLSNFDIPYRIHREDKNRWNVQIKSMDPKTIGKKTRDITFLKGNISYEKSIKNNSIKYIDNYKINIDFFEYDSNKIDILEQYSKTLYHYFFSDSIININFQSKNIRREFIIVRKDLRNNLFSKLFPGSILEKDQKTIKDGKYKNCGYLTFTYNDKTFNIIPPFAFTSKRKNKEILIESFLLGISIKKQQEKEKQEREKEMKKLRIKPLSLQLPFIQQSPTIGLSLQKSKFFKTIKCMVVTHNSILRCFLKQITGNNVFLKTRFKNNAIIRITINKDNSFIEMVSEGYLPKETKKVYFTKNNNKFSKMDTNLEKYWNILGYNLEIYIIRHGVSYHNIRNILTKHLVYDTSLVQEHNNLNHNNKNVKEIDYYFVSPLIRTRQTLIKLIPNIKDEKIVILPCSREIGSIKGNCRQETIKPFENRTWTWNKNKPKTKNITWDWSFYDREKGKCPEDSNMIYEMMKYIFYKTIHSN